MGAPWADIPDRYGPHTTCVNRVNRWRRTGIRDRLLTAVSKAYDGDVQMIDLSSIRVYRHTANGKKATRSRCMGRSRGGLTTKIRALVDACDLPILLKLTEGQAHDGRSAEGMLCSVERGNVLLADAGYDSNALHEALAARGARASVKPMLNRLKPHCFNRRLYHRRNLAERLFNKLKHFRAVATRYDKRDDNYIASVKLAATRIWMRFNESVT